MLPVCWHLLWWVGDICGGSGLECPFVFKSIDCVDGYSSSYWCQSPPLLRVIMAERIGEEKRGCWLDAPNKGIHKMVFELALAITAVAACCRAISIRFLPICHLSGNTNAFKEFGVSCRTVPEYGKANGSYLKDPLWRWRGCHRLFTSQDGFSCKKRFFGIGEEWHCAKGEE